MEAKLTLTKPAASWGAQGERTHAQPSELVAEATSGWVVFSIKAGAVNAHDVKYSSPEAVAAISLTMEHVRSLAAFLASLPPDE